MVRVLFSHKCCPGSYPELLILYVLDHFDVCFLPCFKSLIPLSPQRISNAHVICFAKGGGANLGTLLIGIQSPSISISHVGGCSSMMG